MGKYGNAATSAGRACAGKPTTSPRDAWDNATSAVFGAGTPSQDKSCPRGAFLGLCGAGLVKGIPPGAYTTSKLNASYALSGVALLTQNADLASDPQGLWELVQAGVPKQENGQMDVVVSLWSAGLLATE